jgi:hypothetical protein
MEKLGLAQLQSTSSENAPTSSPHQSVDYTDPTIIRSQSLRQEEERIGPFEEALLQRMSSVNEQVDLDLDITPDPEEIIPDPEEIIHVPDTPYPDKTPRNLDKYVTKYNDGYTGPRTPGKYEASCSEKALEFVTTLAYEYVKHNHSDKSFSELRSIYTSAKRQIVDWLITGDLNDIALFLFSPVPNRNGSLPTVPIFWTGFWVEDPTEATNPIKSMNESAQMLNGYTTLTTYTGTYAQTEQNNIWGACVIDAKDKYLATIGNRISKAYASKGLENHPREIGYFVNKDSDAILRTYFYNTELDIINSFYEHSPLTINIFNIKDNCDDVVKLLRDKLNNPRITFKCYTGKSLIECVQKKLDEDSQSLGTVESKVAPAHPDSRGGKVIRKLHKTKKLKSKHQKTTRNIKRQQKASKSIKRHKKTSKK